MPLKSRNARVGFEAPVSYENTWEGMKVEGWGASAWVTLIPMKAGVLTGICSD